MTKPLKIAPYNVIEKSAWLYIDNRRVLFARSRGQTLAYTIGGKIEPGEMVEEALVREVTEETGVRLLPGSIEFYFLFVGPCDGYVEGTKLKMYAYTARYEGAIAPQAEIEELIYLTSADIGKGRTTTVGEQILDHLAYQGRID
ncbi:NUDIX domain-containing protein [Candidatus Nomurabacteria bacterium]|nr:NUDIX domain-containing protein [Candidatus Nomurabacteria bacterium]